MATFNAKTYAAQLEAQINAGKMIGTAELISGRVSYLQAKFTVPTGGLAASDIVNLAFLPSGMTIITGMCAYTVVTADATDDGAHELVVTCPAGVQSLNPNLRFNTVGSKILSFGPGVAAVKCTERAPIYMELGDALAAGTEVIFHFSLVNSN